MIIIIRRGQNQIGGNIVEIATDSTKILLDIGCELHEGAVSKCPQISGLFDSAEYDAIFISHYHLDHMGLLQYIDKNIPIYMGESAAQILNAAAKFKNETPPRINILFNSNNKIVIGDLTVTPYLCDHSAFDSYMFLVESGGETVLYTGDFRANGRKNFNALIDALPKSIDTLICEGTTLSRSDRKNITEKSLETRATNLFKAKSGPIFVLQSAMNIDRVVTVYKAAKRSNRMFLQDLYMAEICSAVGGNIPNPLTFNDVKVFVTCPYNKEHQRYKSLSKYGRKKIGKSQIAKNDFVMCVRSYMVNYIKSLNKIMDFSDGVLVYSMWEGYKEQPQMQEFLSVCEALGLEIVSLHTSGHADVDTIELLIDRVTPKKIIPIHTENAKWFSDKYPHIMIEE